MTRAEHLAWAKQRALVCCDHNDPNEAFNVLVADLKKHPELEDHTAIQLGLWLKMAGQLRTVEEMREFIVGFQ